MACFLKKGTSEFENTFGNPANTPISEHVRFR